jgi:hypothetical protein
LNSGFRAVLVTAGGGSGALSTLLTTPGASRFVADAHIPYSTEALERFLGEKPEHAVSPVTARALAEKAFDLATGNVESALRADLRSQSAPCNNSRCVGIACSAALQTDRERRGADRAFICIKTGAAEKVYALYLSRTSRADQEALLSDWLLALIAQATGAERGLLLPGSFNPVHQGHCNLLKVAEEMTGLTGCFELSSVNVDKPELPEEEILRRASAVFDVPVALTAAPRFIQKAQQFPKTTFVLGYDTAARLIDPAYGQETPREGTRPRRPENGPRGRGPSSDWLGMWRKFEALETRFLVAGRLSRDSEAVGTGDDRARRARLQSFLTLESLNLPDGFDHLFAPVPEELYREDISSTELRG